MPGIGIQSKPSQSVIEKGTPDLDRRLSPIHAVVERDDLCLRRGKIRMRAYLEDHVIIPLCVFRRHHRGLSGTANLNHPREKEILEDFVGQTIGARMPAEAIKSDGMGAIQRQRGSGFDKD